SARRYRMSFARTLSGYAPGSRPSRNLFRQNATPRCRATRTGSARMAVSTLRQHDKLNRLARRQHWLGPFLKFIDSIRIDSKEVPAEDERGSKLHLWTTQRLFLEQLAE